MAYGKFKELLRRTASDKILRGKACIIAKNSKHDGYQRGLASMVFKFSDETTGGGAVKNGIIQNKELAEEVHKTVIRKFEKRKVHSSFIDNI